jgi:hypothetical protein
VRKATGIFDRVFGVNRSVRIAGSYRPAYLLAFLLLLTPNSALGQAGVNSGASWSQYKSQCGIPASTAYNDWRDQGAHCPKTEGASSTSPAVPALNPQQQLAMQGAALAGNMIGQALVKLLFAPPAPPPVAAQPDPEQQQRELAAQQLNNSGLYLLKQRNYASAINEFQKALATNPNDSNALHNLALAKQKLKDAAVAGQTSGALGQFLGNAPANTGLFGFAQLTGSTTANPNASALSLVNLDSDANVVDLRGTTKTYVDPESLKGQLDGVLGTNAPASAPPGPQVVLPQDKDMELLSTLSQSGGSQSQVVPPQNKDMELLSTLSETGAPQSHVVLPQDKDMELLGFPAPSNESDLNNSKSSAPATANNVGNNSALNSVRASTPAQTPASDRSLQDAVGDRPAQASTGGTTNAFGTTSNPSNPDLNSSAPVPAVAVHSAHDQLGSAANSGAAATINARSEAAKVELSCVFDKSACATSAPAAVRAVPPTPSASADLQIPKKMLNDPEVHMLNHYKQQAQDAHKAAAAAQATFEAEQKKDPHSNQLVVLQEQAKEAQDKAGTQDNMVKFQTGEVQKKIKFATINTGGDSNTNP